MEAFEQVEKEVGALIGTELELSLLSASLVKKQGFLENQSGRNSIIGVSMRGRYEGDGCLVVAEDCAVRLAGKMLMLPSTELNDIIRTGSYTDEEELSYAFDELAKCLVFSFLETFQRSSNFISTITCQSQILVEGRKEMAEKLDHLSADQTYYQVGSTITLAGVTTKGLSLLLPAFVLVCSEPFKKHSEEQSLIRSERNNQEQPALILSEPPDEYEGGEDDVFFPHLQPVLQKELSNLLGITVQIREKGSCSGPLPELLLGADTSPQQRTRISISGVVQTHGWLSTATRDAMKLGRLLTDGTPGILLSGSLADDFNVDCQDGYQEICSIFIDILDLVCNDLSEGELFMKKEAVKKEAELEFESADRLDDNEQIYMRLSLELAADTHVCGTMHILLPMGLYANLKTFEPAHSPVNGVSYEEAAIDDNQPFDSALESEPSELSQHAAAVLLIEDSSVQAPELLNSLEKAGIIGEGVSLSDDLSKADLDSYRAVLLVLERLDEIGLGMVIKIKSSSSVPLIVAASLWTQKDVMKALRYGVDDIIVLPAESDELLHKLKARDPLRV